MNKEGNFRLECLECGKAFGCLVEGTPNYCASCQKHSFQSCPAKIQNIPRCTRCEMKKIAKESKKKSPVGDKKD